MSEIIVFLHKIYLKLLLFLHEIYPIVGTLAMICKKCIIAFWDIDIYFFPCKIINILISDIQPRRYSDCVCPSVYASDEPYSLFFYLSVCVYFCLEYSVCLPVLPIRLTVFACLLLYSRVS